MGMFWESEEALDIEALRVALEDKDILNEAVETQADFSDEDMESIAQLLELIQTASTKEAKNSAMLRYGEIMSRAHIKYLLTYRPGFEDRGLVGWQRDG